MIVVESRSSSSSEFHPGSLASTTPSSSVAGASPRMIASRSSRHSGQVSDLLRCDLGATRTDYPTTGTGFADEYTYCRATNSICTLEYSNGRTCVSQRSFSYSYARIGVSTAN